MSYEAPHHVVPHHDAPHYDAPHYLAARVQRALAEDERTYELGIRVDIRGDQLFLRGQVEGDERRRLVAAVAGETAPGLRVHNEVTVVEVRGPGEEETL
ncbi:BON domain-containing protein [Sphaerisporangium dianthi]|uniref:BON domain-containing protein n=1 Tax=Sphaerisporangium dianthi TaxID=1436120 RepID=A0ABV9CM27_9ACTN